MQCKCINIFLQIQNYLSLNLDVVNNGTRKTEPSNADVSGMQHCALLKLEKKTLTVRQKRKCKRKVHPKIKILSP